MNQVEAGRLGGLASKKITQEKLEIRIEEYNKNPKLCKNCFSPISYYKRVNVFCSSSCSALYYANKKKESTKQKCLNCDNFVKKHHRTVMFCSYKCVNSYERKEQIKAGTASAKVIKSYLLEHYGNICMDPECIWDFSIRPINVELEHKDGNSEHNTLENCILLCPNCHSLTSTYKNKNAGNGRHRRRQRYAEGKSY